MYLRFILAVVLLCVAGAAFAQPRHPLYWDDEPKLHAIPDSLNDESAVIVLEERRIQMQGGMDGFGQYYTVHQIIRINDDRGAESFNTFGIPTLPGTRFYEMKARTILPGNKVVTVSRDKIRKKVSESGLTEYLIALEGVTRGAEVELLYTEMLPGSANGVELYQQKIPVMKAVFRMYVPDNMRYEAKGYNGFPTPKDTFLEDQRRYSAVTYGIPGLREEPNSRYRASLQRVDYKLSYVLRTETAKERRMSWPDMAKELYRRYIRIGAEDLAVAAAFMQQESIAQRGTDAEKIAEIENYFKTRIAISGLRDESAEDFSQTIRKKLTTEKGYVRLFAACLNAAGVKYEVGMAGSRFRYQIDDSLEMWNYLTEYCLYFPVLHSYTVPAAKEVRYPFIPDELCGAKAIFTRAKTAADTGFGVRADIRALPYTAAAQSGVELTANVKFEGASLTPVVSTTILLRGYSAGPFRQALLAASGEKQLDLLRTIIDYSDKRSDVSDTKVESIALSNYTTGKPLMLSAKVQAGRLMEKAGTKYLFKAGELIGKQSNLYTEDKRRLPVDIEFPSDQPRTLRITIPAGYKVVNPNVLRSKAVCSIDGAEACGFQSDFKMEGTELVVTIREFYNRTDYPLSSYEAYRSVVNAAADFNKVVLVLQRN